MRPVLLLAAASEDLEAARDFYNEREPGAGEYCVDSLLTDIESLSLYHGMHRLQFAVVTGCWPSDFRLGFITSTPMRQPR